MKRTLPLGVVCFCLLIAAGCSDSNLSSRHDARYVATSTGDDYNFHVHNLANAMMAKDPKLSLKEAQDKAQAQVASDQAASQAVAADEAYQRQKKSEAQEKFLADLDKAQHPQD